MTLPTILFLGVAQAAFLVALLAAKRGRTLPDGILAAWILVLGVHHLLYALMMQGTTLPAVSLNLNSGVPLLQGPFLFLYVRTLASGERRLRPRDALHLLPYLGFGAYVSLALPRVGSTPHFVSVFHLSSWITVAILVSVPLYALAALRRLRRHRVDLLDRHSERAGRDLSWLRRIVLALLAVWGVVILSTMAPSLLPVGARHQMMSAVTLFIYAIGYFGWRQFAVADPAPLEPDGSEDSSASESLTGEESEVPAEPPKYHRSGLGSADIQALVERLREHLESDRPYLEPGVTLKQIADDLATTPNRLSQAINQGIGKNFHELINERRVAAFKRDVLDPRNRHRNLLAVAFDSGFSSKSSFNRVFKQIEGVSPREYCDRCLREGEGEDRTAHPD